MVELRQAGLQGVEALGHDGRHRGGYGAGGSCGGRGGEGLALRVHLAVEKSRVPSLTWALHPQKPRNPLQQNEAHLSDRD